MAKRRTLCEHGRKYGSGTVDEVRTQISVWDRIFDAVTAAYDGDQQIIDSSSIRAHQHAANDRKRGGAADAAPGCEPDPRCMGRSRGGLTTNIHAMVGAEGRPIARALTPGQALDGRSAAPLLKTVGEGDILLADRAYDAVWLRDAVAARGGWANIKPMPTRKRIPSFSPFFYRYRNLAERFFNRMKHDRAIATRLEGHAANYLALVKLAATKIWLRGYQPAA